MSHPYQAIRICKSARFGDAGLLLAAYGPNIVSANLTDGSIISQWPAKDESSSKDAVVTEQEGPPGKKRKLEKKPAAAAAASPTVIKLVLTHDESHAVAVTGDDKCIRVFGIAQDGSLNELSQRCMPKRPCAIFVTPDNTTIICGDKFGDVYSLPLIPNENYEHNSDNTTQQEPDSTPAKAYVPTATNLTVHTGRNRRALEMQLKQKDLHAKTKEALKFEHQLLLGHVSMLTDVHLASQTIDGIARNFIITSDRDEHIRVSRMAPQAYVIERFCLGHTEFISKLCLVPGSNLLVSGGGDDWLGVWDWTTGKLLNKCSLKAIALSSSGQSDSRDEEVDGSKIAVSGLWFVPHVGGQQAMLLVALEKVPAIFLVQTHTLTLGNPKIAKMELPGNPLDMATSGSTLIFSCDTASSSQRLLAYKLKQTAEADLELVTNSEFTVRLQGVNGLEGVSAPAKDALYGIENMRKRGNEDEQDLA